MAFGKRILFAAVVVTAAGVAASHPMAIGSLYHDLYPPDPAERQALELCFVQDHDFNRLDAGERENCYRRVLAPVAAQAGLAVANPVDLHRAAFTGSMPRNDVRRTEQTQDALHLPH
jgi:hypothetical protein